ncbi:Dirigent protein 21 [Sesamum alatum]|uniref:Dirigent protein n=1 Tax=Sesamum alatum TaxID=300844 RepID=A0AAE1Y5E1_9LAMI|nr:Dirigent protein 21 [Sesamum alatum]
MKLFGKWRNPISLTFLPSSFGLVAVLDNLVTSGPEIDSQEVGRMQGIIALADLREEALAMLLNIVFTEGEFKGSTLSILGRNPLSDKVREVPIVGGIYFRWAGLKLIPVQFGPTVDIVIRNSPGRKAHYFPSSKSAFYLESAQLKRDFKDVVSLRRLVVSSKFSPLGSLLLPQFTSVLCESVLPRRREGKEEIQRQIEATHT